MNDYYCLTFNLNPYIKDAADLLAAFLADIGFDTFEESEDGKLLAYIREDLLDEEKIRTVTEDFTFPIEISYTKERIEFRDWNEEWEKKYYKPLVLADGKCVIHSTFHTDYPESPYEIIIDPKMAFGTGHHATTTMMVNYLFKVGLEDKFIVDMGTGTGILAIIAKKLGASKAIGVEIDPAAFENAQDNVLLNKADVDLLNGDVTAIRDIKNVDVFLANINRNIILADMDQYISTLSSNGELILSGFYRKDIPLIERALTGHKMKIMEVANEGEEWAAIRAVFDS